MKAKLEYGSRGNAVSEAQAKLNALLPDATPPLVIDGIFGFKTVQRVKQFQRLRGLVADGIVGARTWAALDGPLPPKPTGPSAKGTAQPSLAATRVRPGAKTVCSCGSRTSALKFAPVGRSIANVRDCQAIANVGPFGKCHSLYNPKVQFHMQTHAGTFSPQPCVPFLQGPWSPGAPLELVGDPPAAALGADSVIVCALGGVITIVDKAK